MPGEGLKIVQFVRGSERYGASVSIKNLSLQLKAQGHDVTLMTFKGRTLGDEMAGFNTIELEPFNKFNIRGILHVRDILKAQKPDLVHTHLSAATLSGSFAARLAKVPVIATVHGMNQRWTYSFANRLITVSEAAKKHLVRQGIRSNQISVAYNGIALPTLPSRQAKSKIRASLGLDEHALVIGSTSRADFGKGIQNAIDAAAMLRRKFPTLHYVFAGEGEYLSELRAQAAALKVEGMVHFLGFRDDVLDLLSAMDVFLFPSLKEAMGISIIEAMAMGLPVVSSDVGGIPEVVDVSTGITTPANDVPAIANACERLLSNAETRETMGRSARERVESHFSLEASAKAVLAAYKILLKR
ncbi:MAG TPA: glycosyltransferase family 4 protein [Fimbriimonadaceae bacterium]|jgi:glycosyltransferase involved in cell wall biosynthesis